MSSFWWDNTVPPRLPSLPQRPFAPTLSSHRTAPLQRRPAAQPPSLRPLSVELEAHVAAARGAWGGARMRRRPTELGAERRRRRWSSGRAAAVEGRGADVLAPWSSQRWRTTRRWRTRPMPVELANAGGARDANGGGADALLPSGEDRSTPRPSRSGSDPHAPPRAPASAPPRALAVELAARGPRHHRVSPRGEEELRPRRLWIPPPRASPSRGEEQRSGSGYREEGRAREVERGRRC